MEFGHLSNETRKKIEEFRRRRKQAEEYNENSPVKPPKVALVAWLLFASANSDKLNLWFSRRRHEKKANLQ